VQRLFLRRGRVGATCISEPREGGCSVSIPIEKETLYIYIESLSL